MGNRIHTEITVYCFEMQTFKAAHTTREKNGLSLSGCLFELCNQES
jgi:hypothetical protein